jgi:nuclear RNA export factor
MAIRGASKATNGTVRPRRLGVQGILENGMTSRTRPTQHSTVELWRTLVKRRYNAEIQLLNLENLAEDEEIIKLGLRTGSKEYAVMFKLAAELQPPVQSLSLANNAISSGSTISALSRYLPNIANLSLQDNKLERHRDLDYVSGRKSSSFKLQHLRELILTGNPLRENEARAGKLDLFRHEIARRIPSLEMLDNDPLVKIAFDAPQATPSKPEGVTKPPPAFFPVEMMPGFISPAEGPIVHNFLGNFLRVFDQDRPALEVLYHPSATFSFSANTTIPTRSRLQGFQHSKEMPHQTALEWGPWLNGGGAGSRNLSRVAANPEKAINSLHVGPAAIVRAFQDLPKTVHTIEGHLDHFSYDAWLVGEGSPLPYGSLFLI